MLDIAEVARRSLVPASTLRYYEARGLIQSIGRRGLRRTFDTGVLQRLAFIKMGQGIGFSLDQVAELIGPGAASDLNRRMLSDKADELDATILKLTALRDELRRAAACPESQHKSCPNFRRWLDDPPTRTRSGGGSGQ